MVFLQRGEIHHLAIGRESHAVAAALVGFFPEDFVREQIEAGDELQRAHVEPLRGGAGDDALHVERLAVGGIEPARRDAPDEAMAVVDVEHEHAMPAAFEVVADAGDGGVEEAPGGGPAGGGGVGGGGEAFGAERRDCGGAQEIPARGLG
jgi:hypothetical protein